MTKKRIDWVDYLKALSVICVVAYHVIDGMHNAVRYNNYAYILIKAFTEGVALSAFFLASGLFANSWLKKKEKIFTESKNVVGTIHYLVDYIWIVEYFWKLLR